MGIWTRLYIWKVFIGGDMFYKSLLLYFVPAFLIITSFVCNKVKDNRINDKYGYRSALSMKSKANWYYANEKMAKISLILSLILN